MSATGRSDVRREGDFYATPSWATRAILPHLPLEGSILEPCAGEGAIIGTLTGAGVRREMIAGIELDPGRARRCEQRTGVGTAVGDFLTRPVAGVWDLIITNPPFELARECLERALTIAGGRGTVAFLLRLAFVESEGRQAFHAKYPSDLFVLAKRPSFVAGTTDNAAYAWFVFGPGRGGRWRVLPADVGQGDLFNGNGAVS